MVVKSAVKPTRKPAAKSTTAKRSFYKVAATYVLRFRTKAEASKARSQIAQNKKAIISTMKKAGNYYTFSFKFVFVTPDAKIKERAVKEIRAKSPSAKVSVSVVKA
jgi:hypothetical protein